MIHRTGVRAMTALWATCLFAPLFLLAQTTEAAGMRFENTL